MHFLMENVIFWLGEVDDAKKEVKFLNHKRTKKAKFDRNVQFFSTMRGFLL